MKRLQPILLFFGIMILFSQVFSYAESEWAKEVEMPPGDIQAGREAFIRFECYQCHRVEQDSSLPAAAGEISGPVFKPRPDRPKSMLDEMREEMRTELDLPQVDYLPEIYAMAIMSPSHSIAPGFGSGSAEDEPESMMPDFDREMTVRELRDIVAYLTQQ